MGIIYSKENPPVDTLFVNKWADFKCGTSLTSYVIVRGQFQHEIALKGHIRQVLEGLIRGPVCAASRCRISERVRQLKHIEGVEIETHGFQPVEDGERFGVYQLACKVYRKSGGNV